MFVIAAATGGLAIVQQIVLVILGLILLFVAPRATIHVVNGIGELKNGEAGWMNIIGGLGQIAAPFLVYFVGQKFLPGLFPDPSTINSVLGAY